MDDNYGMLYDSYFSKETETSDVENNDNSIDKQNTFTQKFDPTEKEKGYTYENELKGIPIESTLDYGNTPKKWTAEDNISSVDALGRLIKKLLDTAWGEGWGQFGSDFKESTDSQELILPQITIDEHEREVSSNKPIKPQMTDNILEVDNQGKATGDSFNVYRQWFDVLVEFNVYGKTKKEAREIAKRFEMLLMVYMKHLKKKGISEMVFLKAMTGSQSERYNKDLDANMTSLLYLVKLERITKVRVSTLNKLEYEVNQKES